jgi:ribonuclease D
MTGTGVASNVYIGTTATDSSSWPLSYRLKDSEHNTTGPKRWWSYALYRGPSDKPVTILYSKNKAESEAIAKRFLHEPVVGFDMEWPWDSHKRHRLQEMVGLIQVACEDKIGLFHIGLHPGTTTEELIAPSLRMLIESPAITKTGVCILKADMSRLTNFFKLRPKGALELSHLHRLVTFGGQQPELVNTKFIALDKLVEQHLGLPLSKGSVRTSNWSKALNQKQKEYAASDAYAGFMLFHCMNAKRLAMNPMPPLPLHADQYPFSKGKFAPLLLEPVAKGEPALTVQEFFAATKGAPRVPHTTKSTGIAESKTSRRLPRGVAAKTKTEKAHLDPISQTLFDLLLQRRKALASEHNIVPYRIATNVALEGLAKQRPLDQAALLQVKGIGPWQQQRYGDEWLQVIRSFLALPEIDVSTRENPVALPSKTRPVRLSGDFGAGQVEETHERLPPSSPAFGPPPRPAPKLHTCLSFTLAETRLDAQRGATDLRKGPFPSSGESVVFLAEHSAPPRKRKRSKSPPRVTTPPAGITGSGPEEPWTPKSRIFRSKMEAYSKRIASMLHPRPMHPLVSSFVLDHIVKSPPRTREELDQIPGIEMLAEACARLNKDLLGNIAKFSAARY